MDRNHGGRKAYVPCELRDDRALKSDHVGDAFSFDEINDLISGNALHIRESKLNAAVHDCRDIWLFKGHDDPNANERTRHLAGLIECELSTHAELQRQPGVRELLGSLVDVVVVEPPFNGSLVPPQDGPISGKRLLHRARPKTGSVVR